MDLYLKCNISYNCDSPSYIAFNITYLMGGYTTTL